MIRRNLARLAAIAALAAHWAAPARAEFPIGKKAPEFALKTLDGKPLSTAALRGKIVLLNFWGPT